MEKNSPNETFHNFLKKTEIQKLIYDSATKKTPKKRIPREIRRAVNLSCALEPLSEKLGCTTRSSDVSPYLKLEYFISSAINIGDAFEDLAIRISEEKGQPKKIYDLAFHAQEDCIRNRAGGRINQGIIELLVPIVSAQMIYDIDFKKTTEEILEDAKIVMKRTSREDVDELIQMKRLAFDMSAYHDRVIPIYPGVENVYDYYSVDFNNSGKATSRKHNEEFIRGFPTVKELYQLIRASNKISLNSRVEEAYSIVRSSLHENVGKGKLTADHVAAALYLLFSENKNEMIIV